MSESLIAATKRLAELEKARDADHDCTIFAFLEQLQATAPKMLKVLSQFQAGDAETLQFFLSQINIIAPCDFESEISKADYMELEEVLVRMQKAASLMEANE
ncbi:hypothetical protein M0R72_19645 [Candidatus Pacearchaeota archaeon]|jgi:hypothetical protein|nr:hypothetical protein [Candidatus Pacearchaeota archaeon]